MDRYPDDLFEQIRLLTARVAQLEAQQKVRPATTRASQGWVIGDMGEPATPTSGGHLYSSGGQPMWLDSSGTSHPLITPPITPGVDPGGIDGLTTPADWPTTYSDVIGERVTVDLQSIRLYASSIRVALVNAGFLA